MKENKTTIVQARLTADQKDKLDKLAKAFRVTPSEIVRDLINNNLPNDPPSRDFLAESGAFHLQDINSPTNTILPFMTSMLNLKYKSPNKVQINDKWVEVSGLPKYGISYILFLAAELAEKIKKGKNDKSE